MRWDRIVESVCYGVAMVSFTSVILIFAAGIRDLKDKKEQWWQKVIFWTMRL